MDNDSTPAIRWLLAALSSGAGAIHLAMVPQHAQEALGIGLAFAAAGWFQIAFGVGILARPIASGCRPRCSRTSSSSRPG